jgi:hypothetical protein
MTPIIKGKIKEQPLGATLDMGSGNNSPSIDEGRGKFQSGREDNLSRPEIA